MSTGLRQLAQKDLGRILEDESQGFGWPIVVIDPQGASVTLSGRVTDISEALNVDTGQMVSGRFASATIRIALLIEKGLSLPEGIADTDSKPWLIKFDDINGNNFTFKVAKSNPDRTLGLVTCMLELYQ